ncbi:MAG: hypothetical protein DRG59_06900 [Deltaproteobacteria bacterium]|nr:MAG: hypothetical protein DRG59_06900 [Deltaproteobacteria bacterium]
MYLTGFLNRKFDALSAILLVAVIWKSFEVCTKTVSTQDVKAIKKRIPYHWGIFLSCKEGCVARKLPNQVSFPKYDDASINMTIGAYQMEG